MNIQYPTLNPTRKEKIDYLELQIFQIYNLLKSPGDIQPEVFDTLRGLQRM